MSNFVTSIIRAIIDWVMCWGLGRLFNALFGVALVSLFGELGAVIVTIAFFMAFFMHPKTNRLFKLVREFIVYHIVAVLNFVTRSSAPVQAGPAYAR